MTKKQSRGNILRRDAFKLGGAAALAMATLVSSRTDTFAQSAEAPVVTTKEGQLRGTSTERLNIFKGVHYGETTGGKGRFRHPVALQPFEGFRDASKVGDPCFQNNPDWEGWKENNNGSEDCLVLNVWAPKGSKDKPVMVYFHGGAYMYGSGGAPMYDAAGLAERGDVVAITVNHRLHALGFMHLADISPDYRGQSNAGLADLVEALRWVKRNISAFGGSPDNVTIFGESGGGGKVNCLLSMPSAQGLFHKAIVQSGSQAHLRDPAQATTDARAALKILNIGEDELSKLEQIDPQSIWDAYIKVSESNIRGGLSDAAFSPVLDAETLPFAPGSSEAIALSKAIPVLVGSNQAEGTFPLLIANMLKAPTDEKGMIDSLLQLFPKIGEQHRADLQALVATYNVKRPGEDLLNQIVGVSTEIWMGSDAIRQAESRAAANTAPVYMYRFGWKEPCFGGAWATHAAELPFVFDNLEIDLIWGDANLESLRDKYDPEKKRYAFRDTVIGAWSSFARDGKPSASGIPDWPEYDLESKSTMLLDKNSSVVNDPLGPEMRTGLMKIDAGIGS